MPENSHLRQKGTKNLRWGLDLDLASTSSVVMTSTKIGFSHITCWPHISLRSPLELDHEENTHQTQVEPHTDQRG